MTIPGHHLNFHCHVIIRNILHLQVYEGRGRSMLLSSCRGEAKLWDVGACKNRAEALWAPNETIGDSLRTFEGVRSAVFRPDGLLVQTLHVPYLAPS